MSAKIIKNCNYHPQNSLNHVKKGQFHLVYGQKHDRFALGLRVHEDQTKIIAK